MFNFSGQFVIYVDVIFCRSIDFYLLSINLCLFVEISTFDESFFD